MHMVHSHVIIFMFMQSCGASVKWANCIDRSLERWSLDVVEASPPEGLSMRRLRK